MDGKLRDYFAGILLQTRGLSELPSALSVIICRKEELIASRYSKVYSTVIPAGEVGLIYTTPLYSALFDFIKKGSPSDCSVFFSYFPSPIEVEMLISSEIYKIYFLGDITNPATVTYLNTLQRHKVPVELSRINVSL
jgi:hypothetical protein